jgi:5-formyltetrahydrofolate cyclo-ligase
VVFWSLKLNCIALPKVKGKDLEIYLVNNLEKDLEVGSFQVKEPNDNCERVDAAPPVILVPGLAFDRNTNHRLGYGGGFYDQLLARSTSSQTIGVCFEFQLVDALPRELHDMPVDSIVTDKIDDNKNVENN